MKEKIIKFTKAELKHLLELVYRQKESFIYWGRKDYFMKRQKKIAKKLNEGIHGI